MNEFKTLAAIFVSIYIVLTLRSIAHRNIATASIYNLVGTFAHEFSHLLFALIFNAKPTSFNILPRRSGDWFILGSVTCKNMTWYNAFPVGLAPLSLVPLSYLIYTSNMIVFGVPNMDFFVRIFFSIIILYSSIPSMQDIKVAISKPFGASIYGVMIITEGLKHI